MKTVLRKSHGGYIAESRTETDANGNFWEITTHKYNGGRIICQATQGQDKGDGMASFDMFGAKRLQLASDTVGRATDKAILEVHAKGLEEFARVQAEQPEEVQNKYVIEVGQVIFSDFPAGDGNSDRRAVCQIIRPGEYKTVRLDGSGFDHDEHVRPYSEKFGIGSYYNEGDKIDPIEVQKLVELATEATEKRDRAEQEAKERAEAEQRAKLEAGAKIIAAIPEGAKAVIVAISQTNTSDYQSDYHGHRVDEVHYLAWSGHDRNLFPEMRKAADTFEPVNHLGTGRDIFQPYVIHDSQKDFFVGGAHYYAGCEYNRRDRGPEFDTMAAAQAWVNEQPQPAPVQTDSGDTVNLSWSIDQQSVEKRGYWGYYLGTGHNDSSGWKVQKLSVPSLEALQIAAAEGRLHCGPTMSQASPAADKGPELEAPPVEAGTVQIIDYSEKAFAVIGDTKPIKDLLKDLGGSFNARLRCGAGWIFSKKRLTAVSDALRERAQSKGAVMAVNKAA